MRIDGLTLSEGSTIKNLSVDTGTAFPSSANSGEMFYRTDGANAGMYVYSGSAWGAIATSATSGSVSSVSVNTANGISGTVDTPTTTPAITLSLGAISPTSINASGSVTAGSFVGDGSSITTGGVEVGTKIVPQVAQSAAYTTVLTDSGKHILHPAADTTARTYTIDSNANVAYPIGTALTFVNQNGAGALSIAITADTMRLAGAGTTGTRTLAANGVATALKITATEWIISGTGLT